MTLPPNPRFEKIAPYLRERGVTHIGSLLNVLDGRPGQHAVHPTESPIEAICQDLLVKFLDPATRKTPQRWISTPFGQFRPDFYLRCPVTRRVLVIECDGAGFHDPTRDCWRDAALLGSGLVQDVVRISGRDLTRRPRDVFYLLARLFPSLFHPRALRVLEREATPEAREHRFAPNGPILLSYPPPATSWPTDGDEPIDDPNDDYPPNLVAADDVRTMGDGWDDYMRLELRGTSPYATKDWRFRYRQLRDQSNLSLDELAALEREAGGIG